MYKGSVSTYRIFGVRWNFADECGMVEPRNYIYVRQVHIEIFLIKVIYGTCTTCIGLT